MRRRHTTWSVGARGGRSLGLGADLPPPSNCWPGAPWGAGGGRGGGIWRVWVWEPGPPTQGATQLCQSQVATVPRGGGVQSGRLWCPRTVGHHQRPCSKGKYLWQLTVGRRPSAGGGGGSGGGVGGGGGSPRPRTGGGPPPPPLNSPTHQSRILESGKMGGMGGGGDGEIVGIAHRMSVVEGCGGMPLRKMGQKWDKTGHK